MLVKITSKRQVTFPARVLDALGVGPGDQLELEEGPDGFTLRARRIDPARLAPLRGKLRRYGYPIRHRDPSAMSPMTPHFGIDTSVLVRLLTGEPAEDFEHCVSSLRVLIEDDGAEVFASNQVIGEAYVAVQHHYGVSEG